MLKRLSLLTFLALTACQGAPAGAPPASTAITSPSPAAGGPATGSACAAPALLVDATGKASVVGSGGASAGSGICVPVQEAGVKAIEARSAAGKYRVTLESPKGKPDSAEPKGGLVLRIYDAASASEIKNATVALVFVHSQMGSGHGLDPNGMPVAASPDGGYKLEPLAWPMAGTWLVTAKIKDGATEDKVHLAFNVI